MDIKVDGKIYRGAETLVMIKLTKQDKINISNMAPGATVYSMFPDSYTVEEVEAALKEFKEES